MNNKYFIKLFDNHFPPLPTNLSSKSIYALQANWRCTSPWITFTLYRKIPTKALAFIQVWHSQIQGWVSPLHMPFGGIISLSVCPEKALKFLLRAVESYILQHKGKQITITSYPACYFPNEHNKLRSVYLSHQYKCHKIHVNYHIPISADSFWTYLTRAEKSRLRKCKKLKFTVEIIPPILSKKVYSFIHLCRLQKNYTIPFSYTEFEALWLAPTQHITVFGVFAANQLIAVSMTARVNRRVLYNFLPASLQAYAAYSPTVLLMENIYEYCQKEQVEILDLGISIDHQGHEKPSLIRFKKNIGGIPSEKITYMKHLNI